MKTQFLVIDLIVIYIMSACGVEHANSKSTVDSTNSTNSWANGSISAGVLNLSAIPNVESFLQSTTSSIAYSSNVAVNSGTVNFKSGLGLADTTTVTPPLFTGIADVLTNTLTGDTTALATQIMADQKSANWLDMKTILATFFEAETKCAIMESTARILERVKEDSAPLCLLQAVGSVGDKVYQVVSGAPLADLTKVFAQDNANKVLQIGRGNNGQTHYEMVQIAGSTSSPNHYRVVYTMCLSSSKQAFRQHTLDIDVTTGAITFKSLANGALDDTGSKPNGGFTLSGYLTSSGAGKYLPDTASARQVTYNEMGAIGMMASVTAQAALKLSDNELSASFFSSGIGTDPSGNSLVRSDKTALDVQYTGTGISDLVIYQGAGRSVINLSGTGRANQPVTDTSDRTIGFAFNAAVAPQYATVTTSNYLSNMASVDFNVDAVLDQSAPLAPDMTAIDTTACSASPTTILTYVDRPEDNAAYRAALIACNAKPADKGVTMCDAIRDLEHNVNAAMAERKLATGSATN